jgi:hypothetical protein
MGNKQGVKDLVPTIPYNLLISSASISTKPNKTIVSLSKKKQDYSMTVVSKV